MDLVFEELRNHPTLRVGAQFSDWDRGAVNGNSLGIFVWVYAESERPAPREISLRNDAQCIARIPALLDTEEVLRTLCPGFEDRATFGHVCINRLILREQGTIAILVTDALGARHHLGNIQFSGNRTTDLVPKIDMGIRPILIASLGRSGSTVLANSLGMHPALAGIGGYPFEYRFFSYCLQALYVVTSPANLGHSMGGDSFESRHSFNVGFNPFNHRDYDRLVGGDHFREYYERVLPADAAQFFMKHARDAIAIHARRKPGAVAFVEKMAGPHLTNLAENICADVREIVLIREFWDLILSMVAFDAKRGTSGFFSATSKEDADSWLAAMAIQHCHLRRRAELEGRIVVSYEELMHDPRRELAAVAGKLDIGTDAAALDSMVNAFGVNDYTELHSTKAQKSGIDLDSLFSSGAIAAVREMLKMADGESAPGADGELPAAWEAGRAEPMGESAGEAQPQWREAFSLALEMDLKEVLTARELERDAAVRDKLRTEGEIATLVERSTRAEGSTQRLLDELARMRKEVAADRRARDKELAAVTDRAERAEEYNASLLVERERQAVDANKETLALTDRAERAEEYCRSLLSQRERELAEASKQLEELNDRAVRAEVYNDSLLEELARNRPASQASDV